MTTTPTEYNLLAGSGVRPLSRGTEYREWRLAVIDILAEKGYWQIISKLDSEPSTDKTVIEKSEKARGLLGRLLDGNHRELYATERDLAKLWKKLESRYAGKDQARIWYLRGELSQVQYKDEPMVDYIGKLEKLFNQLASAGEKQSEKDKLYNLLSHLPLQYHPFRTAISNSPNFEDLKYDDVCNRLLLEYQQIIGDAGKPLSSTGPSTEAFFSGRSSQGRGRGRGGRRFTGSQRQINGTVPNTPSRKWTPGQTPDLNRFPRVNRDSCLHCHEKGHWARDCPRKVQTTASLANEGKGKIVGAWMAATKNKVNRGGWILDSGATHHMSSMRELFANFATHKASISIASGETIEATGIGEIMITVKDRQDHPTPIRLRDVLYVPSLGPQNLVSVRCIQQAGGTVVFGGLSKD